MQEIFHRVVCDIISSLRWNILVATLNKNEYCSEPIQQYIQEE
jgi:hypothetical protein